MHTNYQSLKPATNKLLKKRWDGAAHERHRDKIVRAKPVVDTTSPSTYMHLQYKMKKIQLEEERHQVIDRDNRILLEKMSAIMRTRGRVDNWNDYVPKSLNKNKRTRELIRVTLENQKILARIQSKAPQYSAKKWEEDWMETKKYMGHIRKYSDDWYQQKEAEKRKAVSRASKRSVAASRQESRQDTAVSAQQYSDEEGETKSSAGPPKSAKSTKSAASARSSKPATPVAASPAPNKPLTPARIEEDKPATPLPAVASKPSTPAPAVEEKPASPVKAATPQPATPQPADGAKPVTPVTVVVPDTAIPDLDNM